MRSLLKRTESSILLKSGVHTLNETYTQINYRIQLILISDYVTYRYIEKVVNIFERKSKSDE